MKVVEFIVMGDAGFEAMNRALYEAYCDDWRVHTFHRSGERYTFLLTRY